MAGPQIALDSLGSLHHMFLTNGTACTVREFFERQQMLDIRKAGTVLRSSRRGEQVKTFGIEQYDETYMMLL